MAYKCPETLGNKGFSGTLCCDESGSATLLQHTNEKVQKGIVASGCEVKEGKAIWERGTPTSPEMIL
ncbi:MAG: hypothetical protein PUC59_01840, partial [Firmicutes bacterium]|nr:hypothetical protein [Bacillota bacterium]